KYGLNIPDSVTRALSEPKNETPKPGDPLFSGSQVMLAARPADAMSAAEAAVGAAGYEGGFLCGPVGGGTRGVVAAHPRLPAGLARGLGAEGRREAIISGGELTVTIRGKGRGGPNQEYALALAIALQGMPAVAALAADTDGTDGGSGSASDPAGALIDGESG